METQHFSYDNKIVKYFAYATILWGVVGMLVGLLAALQLAFPVFNFNLAYTSFGRIRPVHTNAVIFAFVGNGIFAAVYYSLQRLLKARMFSDKMSWVHFWGWQAIIVSAAVTFVLGITTSKEYAELEWPIDIAITIIWVVFGWNMFGTILRRRADHLYVSIWFYIATFVTVAVLHIGNSIEIPYSWLQSYPVYAGVQDALVQWWYGHNAVAFFLTTPYLGLMYYFLPKAANRPVYSYRLSIIHFWALVFLYIWAGPHHLLYTALPDWAQSLGVVFSIMLIAPSWGGMFNGLLTLRGAWDKVRDNATLKFMVVAVTAYGMSTFEGPMMSLKWVNALTHYTDWNIAHVHIGAMGWNGFLTFGMLYYLFPKMWKTKLYSDKLANAHFWIGTLGIIFYALPLYWGAVVQTLMWKEFTPDGLLAYPNFLETITQILPMYHVRILGGVFYFVGLILMVYNLLKTAASGSCADNENASAFALVTSPKRAKGEGLHRWLERRPVQFMLLATVAILIGGAFEVIPTYLVKSNIPTIESVKPYTPLELEGRDIYIREGCNTCHTQMIRPFRSETERYGDYSKAGELVYNHPHLWGSKRTGPDLAREGVPGGKTYKTNVWHYNHMLDPQKMNAQSIMPAYPWLIKDDLSTKNTSAKIRVMIKLGVPYDKAPYPANYDVVALDDLKKQADEIATDLKENGVEVASEKEIIALIAYLQRLGRDISVKE
ncbi:cytochrome-c oxidase, cbb3-type subunit I [Ancylomarina euxinus]|uniref:cytochrome-c oxidase n=1 Tax=Ancylomarina euxinus TaxID=2283627 RepID=A0A425Y357_9BACT|nr:cytochrome-c oxidase, cbb3-type subunit I [Ancylomarina euxinus]MCZ4693178.1 cytochrome-c oxidase, cbb3-type subunit I [Ancylomarina euxinus]MUP15316.1 cytochrome-c oxidase, cbb3-type subunit I [Ancylomarina euxinus]RRG22555.1 cytochrome-c oxidase, cbb3-type subunit I [Ancylomarina euxinus]